jgi:hypothetical protein
MEFSVRIVNLQLADNNQAYEEIPPVLVLSSFILRTQSKLKFLYVVFLINESFSKTFCKTNNTYE